MSSSANKVNETHREKYDRLEALREEYLDIYGPMEPEVNKELKYFGNTSKENKLKSAPQLANKVYDFTTGLRKLIECNTGIVNVLNTKDDPENKSAAAIRQNEINTFKRIMTDVFYFMAEFKVNDFAKEGNKLIAKQQAKLVKEKLKESKKAEKAENKRAKEEAKKEVKKGRVL